MKQTHQALVFDRSGNPEDVLRLETRDTPSPGPGQVVIHMLAAPINPADFNFIEGTYGIKATPPQIAGLEGVGRIEKTGVAVPGLYKPGTLVIAPGKTGSWCGAQIAHLDELILLPPAVDPYQAAMAGVNPPTALRLLKDFATLVPGDWVVQNAATSGVARSVIQIARQRRLKTLNLVRRSDAVEPLLAAGATAVVDTSRPDWLEQAQSHLGPGLGKLGLNAIGGRAGADLAKLLMEGGILVTYGAMSREPFTLSNAQLIFRDIQPRGFWITRWLRKANQAERQRLYTEIFHLMRDGILQTPIERLYPLAAHGDALRHAARPGRTGKILFELG